MSSFMNMIFLLQRQYQLNTLGRGAGHRAQSTEHRAQGAGHRAQGTGHRAQSTGHRAQGTGRRAQGARPHDHIPLWHAFYR